MRLFSLEHSLGHFSSHEQLNVTVCLFYIWFLCTCFNMLIIQLNQKLGNLTV